MKLFKVLLLWSFLLPNISANITPSQSYSLVQRLAVLYAGLSAFRLSCTISRMLYNKLFRKLTFQDTNIVYSIQNLKNRYKLACKLNEYFADLYNDQFSSVYLNNEQVKVTQNNQSLASDALVLSDNEMACLNLQEDSIVHARSLYDTLRDLLLKDNVPFIDDNKSNDCILKYFENVKIDDRKVNYSQAQEKLQDPAVLDSFSLPFYAFKSFLIKIPVPAVETKCKSSHVITSILKGALEKAEMDHKNLLEAYDQQNNKFSFFRYVDTCWRAMFPGIDDFISVLFLLPSSDFIHSMHSTFSKNKIIV